MLVIRRRQLKNGKRISDVLLCNRRFYNAVRIHKSYATRWNIELHFKYSKQYLGLGQSQFGKLGSIRSQLACVALAALIVALFSPSSLPNTEFSSGSQSDCAGTP